MAKEKEQLTVKQALEQGYKYCYFDDSGLIDITKNINLADFKTTEYLLAAKEAHPYQLSDSDIFEAISDLLLNQDEVGDEDGELPDLIKDIDFSGITETVNKALEARKYYAPTDIRLVP